MEFTFLDPYLNPSAERKTIKRYATVRSGVGIDMIRKRSASTDLLSVLPVRGRGAEDFPETKQHKSGILQTVSLSDDSIH